MMDVHQRYKVMIAPLLFNVMAFIPEGASVKRFYVERFLEHRWNRKLGKHQYLADWCGTNQKERSWTEFVEDAPSLIADFWQLRFMKEVIEYEEKKLERAALTTPNTAVKIVKKENGNDKKEMDDSDVEIVSSPRKIEKKLAKKPRKLCQKKRKIKYC